MIVVNTETIPVFEIVEIKGLVQGNTVRAKHVGRDIAAGFKNLVGGELKGYTELLTESRREATSRMMFQAEQLEMTSFDRAPYHPLYRKKNKRQADVECEREETVVIGGSLHKGNSPVSLPGGRVPPCRRTSFPTRQT